jgi:hypothetical protein
MKTIRRKSSLLIATLTLEACSGIPPSGDEVKARYLCLAQASAGFEFREEKWSTVDISTKRNYEIGPVGPGIPDAPDRGSDETYLIHESGTDVARPCKEEAKGNTSPQSPATNEGGRIISCRIAEQSDPDFSLFEVPNAHPFLQFTFVRRLVSVGGNGNDNSADMPVLELVEIGFCLRSTGEDSWPVVGDCTTLAGSTIVTTRDGCAELDGHFRQ